ncbi:hypothetical protein CAS74_004439 [Pichia kudriavzevii]|uniref:Transcription elongation factor Eaf N-terminal domain-containing protein n=1 Tax=Pichia kudriavzevii TaxID=4909 RepID=A0A1Z8JJK5_PICKU|nr:hypothetical protein CAS74_004439 [Pichia kudriavzevii]
MSSVVPDGEYDIDLSGLFASQRNEVFGIKSGFKPENMMTRDEIPCYLISESKENVRAVSTNSSSDNHIYFQGKINSNLAHALDNSSSGSSMSEYLMSFDEVSKSFKMEAFNGFIKMNKSRDTTAVQQKVKILGSTASTNVNSTSDSYVNSILSSFLKSQPTQKKKHQTLRSPNLSPTLKPVSKVLSSISPIRNSSNTSSRAVSPVGAKDGKSLNTTNQATTSSASPNGTSLKTARSSSVSTSRNTSPVRSPVMKTSRSASTNGGLGTKKSAKSSLLRKAERAVGINRDRIKIRPSSTPHLAPPERKREMHTRREIKEARPDQTAFVLNLSPELNDRPPETKSGKNDSAILSDEEIESLAEELESEMAQQFEDLVSEEEDKTINFSKSVKPNQASERSSLHDTNIVNGTEGYDNKTTTNPVKKIDVHKKITETNNTNTDNTSEGNNTIDDKNVDKTNKDNTIKYETNVNNAAAHNVQSKEDSSSSHYNRGGPVKKEPEIVTNINKSDNEKNVDDDDYQLDFSDWEDADTVGFVLSQDNDTQGNSDFNLIIEDDPLKLKREKELERQRDEKNGQNGQQRFREEVQEKQSMPVNASRKSETPVKARKRPPVEPRSTAPNKRPTKSKNTGISVSTSVTTQSSSLPGTDDLDEMLDEALNDISDEEEVSEEE